MPLHTQAEIIPRPKGDKVLRGSATTTASYAVVGNCKRTVTNGKTFNVAKIAISCVSDAVAKITFGGSDISIEYAISGKIPLTDWFSQGEMQAIGDGSKVLQVEAKYPSGGSADTVYATLAGEEV
jgi:hypothetical protein